MIKQLILKTLRPLGYEIRRVTPPGWLPGRAYWDASYLKRLGPNLSTIFDIGVGAKGTPELYEAFSEAFFVLIDPLEEFEPTMKAILETYNGYYVKTALGSRKETLTMNINPDFTERSSLYTYADLDVNPQYMTQRKIPVTTLDILATEHNFQGPFGIKIDTEGHEYHIIEGAQQVLKNTEFVIAEVSVADNRYEQGYFFEDFIALMRQNGFRVCDILDIGRASSSHVAFLDLVFTKRYL